MSNEYDFKSELTGKISSIGIVYVLQMPKLSFCQKNGSKTLKKKKSENTTYSIMIMYKNIKCFVVTLNIDKLW